MNKCKYFDTVKKKHYIYDRVNGKFSGQTADIEYYICKGTNDRAICTCDGCVDKCDYYRPAALGQLLTLSDSRKVIERLFWDGLIDEDEDEALNIIWRAAEKTIRGEAECLE